jgi:hypothetical protein
MGRLQPLSYLFEAYVEIGIRTPSHGHDDRLGPENTVFFFNPFGVVRPMAVQHMP